MMRDAFGWFVLLAVWAVTLWFAWHVAVILWAHGAHWEAIATALVTVFASWPRRELEPTPAPRRWEVPPAK